MFYANEIRDFDQVPKAEGIRVSSEEIELGAGLIEKLSSENFEPESYEDKYRNRVLAMIKSKVKGWEEIDTACLSPVNVTEYNLPLTIGFSTTKPRSFINGQNASSMILRKLSPFTVIPLP
jgi:DNA end-binding protein Ku